METDYDVVILADLRFTGGTSSALYYEIEAFSKIGIVPAICPILSTIFSQWHDFHPLIVKQIREGKAVYANGSIPATAKLLIIHHPKIFTSLPAEPLLLQSELVLLIVHHPPLNGFGEPEYDFDLILNNIRESIIGEIKLAPVGPHVRQQIEMNSRWNSLLLDFDWSNLIELDKFSLQDSPPNDERIIIGRHSRPQADKWPDSLQEALQSYPEARSFDIRMLGATPALIEGRYGRIPKNWQLTEFSQSPNHVTRFLQGLDFYVYFHGRKWIEAFGYNIMEAIACGIPVIVPHSFESLFGSAAIYCKPEDVLETVIALKNDKDSYSKHINSARKYVDEHFGLNQMSIRLEKLSYRRKKDRPLPQKKVATRKRILMVTSNGIGLGHLTRLLAISDQLPPSIETAFFTLSQGFQFPQKEGYLTQYFPFHQYTGTAPKQWNAAFAEALDDFLEFYRPDLLVFDGNLPYEGLITALAQAQHQKIRRVWVRRALWNKGISGFALRASFFDAIIEPGEFSGRFDCGETTKDAGKVFKTLPIVRIGSNQRLSRSAARKALNVPDNAIVIGLMLGAGNNFSYAGIRKKLLAEILSYPNSYIIEMVSPITTMINEGKTLERHQIIQLYPAYKYTKAFNFMVTGAGYNSFHEALLGAIPSIFVPNEAPEMDRQLLRAQHASQIGVAEIVRHVDTIRVTHVVKKLMNIEQRKLMKTKLEVLNLNTGVDEAAQLLMRFIQSVRCYDDNIT